MTAGKLEMKLESKCKNKFANCIDFLKIFILDVIGKKDDNVSVMCLIGAKNSI